MLQRQHREGRLLHCGAVSNPISGEVGAAAALQSLQKPLTCSFKPHQRGGGCCSPQKNNSERPYGQGFQTPSAGRWVLQLLVVLRRHCLGCRVSNPISGEVGAAAHLPRTALSLLPASFKPHQRGGGCCSFHNLRRKKNPKPRFQTPSAGRWVLPPSRRTRTCLRAARFKPHQRGGGCCSWLRDAHLTEEER